MSTVMVSKRAAPRLKTPVAAAWRRYYRRTKDLRGPVYEDAEPWAWGALQDQLSELKQRETAHRHR